MARNRILAIIASVVIVAASIAYVVVRPIRAYRNTSGGMLPTLPIGSEVLARTTTDVHAGDIIVFRYPPEPKVTYIKRVVAGAGDNVEIRDKRLIVNGREVSEPYVIHDDATVYPRQPVLPEPYRSRDQFGPYQVPANSYFVLGDNRDASSDSRYWGVVPRENVIGRVIYVFKTSQ